MGDPTHRTASSFGRIYSYLLYVHRNGRCQTGTERAIVSPVAGTTCDAVDEMQMKPRRISLRGLGLVVLGVVLPILAQNDDGQTQLHSLAHSFDAGDVGTTVILRISKGAFYRTNIIPQRLEEWWDTKLTIRNSEALGQDLGGLLRTTTIGRSLPYSTLDVRWGVIFYSRLKPEKRIASLYFDETGRRGAINNIPAAFGPNFFPTLKKVLHPSLE